MSDITSPSNTPHVQAVTKTNGKMVRYTATRHGLLFSTGTSIVRELSDENESETNAPCDEAKKKEEEVKNAEVAEKEQVPKGSEPYGMTTTARVRDRGTGTITFAAGTVDDVERTFALERRKGTRGIVVLPSSSPQSDGGTATQTDGDASSAEMESCEPVARLWRCTSNGSRGSREDGDIGADALLICVDGSLFCITTSGSDNSSASTGTLIPTRPSATPVSGLLRFVSKYAACTMTVGRITDESVTVSDIMDDMAVDALVKDYVEVLEEEDKEKDQDNDEQKKSKKTKKKLKIVKVVGSLTRDGLFKKTAVLRFDPDVPPMLPGLVLWASELSEAAAVVGC